MNAGKDDDDPSRGGKSSQSSAGFERYILITNDGLDSRDLFVGTREITIRHGSDAYHLRLTGQNKLILTK
jgi:hemin uptake protein HemP